MLDGDLRGLHSSLHGNRLTREFLRWNYYGHVVDNCDESVIDLRVVDVCRGYRGLEYFRGWFLIQKRK